MITNTTMQCHNNIVTLSRLIKYKLRQIEFSSDVKACDLVQYFNLPDKIFIKLVKKD